MTDPFDNVRPGLDALLDHVTTSIEDDLDQAVADGLLSREDGPDGEPHYSMTEKGRALVESLPNDRVES